MSERIIKKKSWIEDNKIIIENEKVLSDIIQETGEKIDEDSYWILYNQNNVLIGKGSDNLINKNNEIKLDILKEIRLFSEKGELHVWKYGGKFKYRLRLDEEPGEDKIYVEEHFRWNVNETETEKDKKLNLDDSIDKSSFPKKYKVYNYFSYDKNGLIQFYDARLVNFVPKEGGVKYG